MTAYMMTREKDFRGEEALDRKLQPLVNTGKERRKRMNIAIKDSTLHHKCYHHQSLHSSHFCIANLPPSRCVVSHLHLHHPVHQDGPHAAHHVRLPLNVLLNHKLFLQKSPLVSPS